MLDAAEAVLKEMAGGLGRTQGTQPLPHLAGHFVAKLAQTPLSQGEQNGVRVMNIHQLPGHDAPVLFMAGLADGEYPPLPENDFLLGAPVLQYTEPMQESRYLFSQALRNIPQVYLSCPQISGSRSLLLSPFVQALEGRMETLEAEPKHAETLFSRRDALSFSGSLLDNDIESARPMLRALQSQTPLPAENWMQALETAGRRESLQTFSSADGLLSNPHNLDFLRRRFANGNGDEHHYRLQQLDDYALCPTRFFYRHILQVVPHGFFFEDFENSDKGILVHTILDKFYRQRIEQADAPELIRVTGERLEQAERTMKTLAEVNMEAFQASRDNLFWTHEKETLVRGLAQDLHKIRMPKGFLKAFLEFEANSKHRMRPHHLRFVFGEVEHALVDGPVEDCLYIEHVPVSGQVDRIDLCEDDNYLVFMDYRVGPFPPLELIGKGLSFQLPMQWLALEKYARANGYHLGAGGYYQVRSPKQIKHAGWFGRETIKSGAKELKAGEVLATRQRSYGFFGDEDLQEQLQLAQQRILQIDRNIGEGKFNLPLGRDDNLPCAYCPYAKICRKDTLRLEKIYAHIDGEVFYKPLRILRVIEGE